MKAKDLWKFDRFCTSPFTIDYMCDMASYILFSKHFSQPIIPIFSSNFDNFCPVQVHGEKFQVQNFVFLTRIKIYAEFKSGKLYPIFRVTLFFHTFGCKTLVRSIYECCQNLEQIWNFVLCELQFTPWRVING